MYLEGRLNPGVITDSPVLQCPISKQDLYNSLYPALEYITPQTPPPGSKSLFAAFTIASTFNVVISAFIKWNSIAVSFF